MICPLEPKYKDTQSGHFHLTIYKEKKAKQKIAEGNNSKGRCKKLLTALLHPYLKNEIRHFKKKIHQPLHPPL
jgi:hypothetical protein